MSVEANSRPDRPTVSISSYGGDWLAGESPRRYAFVQDASSHRYIQDPLDQEPIASPRGYLAAVSCKQQERFHHELDQASKREILGPRGSVRGHRDVVRSSLESIKCFKRNFDAATSLTSFTPNPTNRQMYLERLVLVERNCCVIYTTSLGVIRRSFEDSKLMRSILSRNLINFKERDIYLNQEFKCQLRLRLQSIQLPAMFVDGHYVGGIKEVEEMNETGKLSMALARFKVSREVLQQMCVCCGNARFIACQSCNGSRKSAIHHFRSNSIALRCTNCDRNNGLVKCPQCFDD